VLPSSIEGLSLALLEAMSHGAPILASDIPTNVEALGGTGWHFRTGDSGDLARRLSELLARPAALLAAGSQAKARALECYSWERVVDRFERVYGSVLSRRRAAGLAGAGT
jgi:glycosyltransferase involved in cell wall biosynthesis